MKAYQVTTSEECVPVYTGTMADAKELLKQMQEGSANPIYYADSRVIECEIQTDKAGILDILNSNMTMRVLRTWRGTSRGGLKEILPEVS